MPRRTPVRELQKEDPTPGSPLRRSTRISANSPVPVNPPKIATRRNSSSETSTSTPKLTRGRRSSLTQESDAKSETEDVKKSSINSRTRSSSQSVEVQVGEEASKTRSRRSSLTKEVVEAKRTPRRRRSASEDSEVERILTESPSQKNTPHNAKIEQNGSNRHSPDDSAPVKSLTNGSANDALESISETVEDQAIPLKLQRKRNNDGKIDLELSVIKEDSFIEEDLLVKKDSSTILKNVETTDMLNKSECEPMEVDEILSPVPPPRSQEKSDPPNEMITQQIDKFLAEDENSEKLNKSDKELAIDKQAVVVMQRIHVVEEKSKETIQVLNASKTDEKSNTMEIENKQDNIEDTLNVNRSSSEEKLLNENDEENSRETQTILKAIEEHQIETIPQSDTEGSVFEKSNSLLGACKSEIATPITNSGDASIIEVETSQSSNGVMEKNEYVLMNYDIGEVREKRRSLSNSVGASDIIITNEEQNGDKEKDRSLSIIEIEDHVEVEQPSENIEPCNKTAEEISEKETDETSKTTLNKDVSAMSIHEKSNTSLNLLLTDSDVEEVNDVQKSPVVGAEPNLNENDTNPETIQQGKIDYAFYPKKIYTNPVSSPCKKKTETPNKIQEQELNSTLDLSKDNLEDKSTTSIHSGEDKSPEMKKAESPTKLQAQVLDYSRPNQSIDNLESTVQSPEKKKTESPIKLQKHQIGECPLNRSSEDIEANKSTTNQASENDESFIQKKKTESPIKLQKHQFGSPVTRSNVEANKSITNPASENDESFIEIDDVCNKSVGREETPNNSRLSNSFKSRSMEKTAITLKETFKAGEDPEGNLSGRIHKVVDLFCSGLKNSNDIDINVSLEYAGQPSDDEDTAKADVINVSLIAADRKEKVYVSGKGSKRRKICRYSDGSKLLLSTAGEVEDTIDVSDEDGEIDSSEEEEDSKPNLKESPRFVSQEEDEEKSVQSSDSETSEEEQNETLASEFLEESYRKILSSTLDENDDDESWKASPDDSTESSDSCESDGLAEDESGLGENQLSAKKQQSKKKSPRSEVSTEPTENSKAIPINKRKLFRLSRYSVEENFAHSSDPLSEDEPVVKKKKANVEKKGGKKSQTTNFSDVKIIHILKPAPSEVEDTDKKARKRKVFNPEQENSSEAFSSKPAKTKKSSSIKPSVKSRKTSEEYKIKPSKRTSTGWEVTLLSNVLK